MARAWMRYRHIGLGAAAVAVLFASARAQVAPEQNIAAVREHFAAPPDYARPMMRWWWFGPAVTRPELEREILAMKTGGIGGFEVQPVYPLALNDAAKGFHNAPYLSDEFLSDVKFAAETARANGMRMDMTLASGWPYGGDYVPVDHASACLRMVAVDLPANAASEKVPALENGEKLITVFAGAGSAKSYNVAGLRQVQAAPEHGRISVAPVPQARVLVFYIAGRTAQQVKRPAVGAEGFVLDHYSKAAVEDHLHTVADRLLQAFGDTPPYAVFSDSLEVYGADWTDDLLPEFQRRRGYDLTPYLPLLAAGTGEVAAEVRHDWGMTLTELLDERYLTPVNDWATAHHTRFRAQNYGFPPASMSSNRLVALPEGEGPQWQSFSFTRWATSASHLYGRPITSSETWTWLHSPAFRATPLDMKAEADRFFLQGINQLIGHGWPYTPPDVAEPGWSFYAAAVFSDHNPWWIVMPDVMKYLQRTSYLLRQGQPANDVAMLLPDDDVYAKFVPGKASLSDGMKSYMTDELTQQIESAGYNQDYVDAESIRNVGIPYPVLVLPHVERLSPETIQAIAAYSARGGKVIAVGSTPSRAPGFLHAEADTAVVQKLSQQLFSGNANAQRVKNDGDLGEALHRALAPDVTLSSGNRVVGFLHRKLVDADIYFVANTSNEPVNASAAFRAPRKNVSLWNPISGDVEKAAGQSVALHLAPYESCVIVLSDTAVDAKPVVPLVAPSEIADWTQGWAVTYAERGDKATAAQKIDTPGDWSATPALRYFSGVATYTKTGC